MSEINKAISAEPSEADEAIAASSVFEPNADKETPVYPFIPLKNVVVFPRVPIKLVIGSRSQMALEEAQARYEGRIVVAAQRERDQVPEGSPYINELYAVGTLVEVTSVQKQGEGTSSTEISVEGICRVRIDNFRTVTSHPNRIQLVEVHELEELGGVVTSQVEVYDAPYQRSFMPNSAPSATRVGSRFGRPGQCFQTAGPAGRLCGGPYAESCGQHALSPINRPF